MQAGTTGLAGAGGVRRSVDGIGGGGAHTAAEGDCAAAGLEKTQAAARAVGQGRAPLKLNIPLIPSPYRAAKRLCNIGRKAALGEAETRAAGRPDGGG